MRKITEVLRLGHDLGFDYRQIASSCLLGLGTISDYSKRAEAAGLKWPLPDGMTEDKLDRLLFGGNESTAPQRPLPDFGSIHEQLRTHKHLTLQLLWDEYRQARPEGYGSSCFCELYQRYRGNLDPVLRQENAHREKCSWTGPATRCRSTTPPVVTSIQRKYSLRCSATVPTPMPKPQPTSRWKPG